MRVAVEEAGNPGPFLLNACTENVNVTPSASPVTRHVVFVVAHERPPGLAITRYLLTTRPPVEAGGCHATLALPRTTLTFTVLGFPGPAMSRATADGSDAGPHPTSFRAATVKV